MADISLDKVFKFPIGTLQRYAPRFQDALADPEAGPDVLAHLAPTFQQDLTAQMALLDKLGVDQSHAHGSVGELTREQRDSVRRILLLCGSARNAAKVVFADDEAVKHGEFFVGIHAPHTFAAIIRRAEIVLGACQARAEALAAHGWSADQTKALEDAITAATESHGDQHATSDDKESFTAEQVNAANGLYRMLRAIQNVARVVYSKARAETDPSVVGKRAKFLLGEFPPSSKPPVNDASGTGTGSSPGGSPAPSTGTTATS
jgi:hypothetical protein